jgi:hypothetical protein
MYQSEHPAEPANRSVEPYLTDLETRAPDEYAFDPRYVSAPLAVVDAVARALGRSPSALPVLYDAGVDGEAVAALCRDDRALLRVAFRYAGCRVVLEPDSAAECVVRVLPDARE